jgi:hypothetical protein
VTSGYRYLDTSALMRRSMAARPGAASTRDLDLGGRVDSMVTSPTGPLGVSELTIMEFRNNLALMVRTSHPDVAAYDVAWAREAVADVMALVASGVIQPVDPPSNGTDHACMLVDIATQDFGISFRVWDALHLLTCLKWGREAGERVVFTTADDDFGRFMDHFPHFGAYVDLDHLVHIP